MKKETIEEAAERQWGNVHRTGVLGFIEGAKFQAERSYSEEEAGELVYNIMGEYGKLCGIILNGEKINELFEQFKKKA